MKTKLLNIRFLATTVFFVFAFMLSGQDYNSLVTKFYEAIEKNNNELAIQYGEQLIKTTNEADSLIGEIKYYLSYQYYLSQNYRKAVELGAEVVDLLKKTKGTNSTDYANSLLTLAEYYMYADKDDEAIKLGTEAVDY